LLTLYSIAVIRCKKLVDATKQMLIVKAPEVLSLHLKRFTPTGRKITSTIKYTASLNLDHYMDSESPSPSYELYAVTVHQGSGPHIGHYYSFVKNKNGKWFEANDESVNISQAKIYASAYILHYIRKPGSALDAIKAGKQSGVNTPRKGPQENGRKERSASQAETPNTESTPVSRGEKRKQRSEDGASDVDQAEQKSEQDATPAKSIANLAAGTSDGHASQDDEQHIRKKNKAQDRPFAPVPSQQFGYGISSVSQAIKSSHGSDRVFEARSQGPGHKNGGKNRGGKINSSPYAAGSMDGKRQRKRMKGRDFKR
jgi:ubiquitin carboxyl-terminal hydrolase 36/42